MNITRDGKLEQYDSSRIVKHIIKISQGINDIEEKAKSISEQIDKIVYDKITLSELKEAIINACLQNIKDDYDYDRIATRLKLRQVYREVLGDYDRDSLTKSQSEYFLSYVKDNVSQGVLDERIAKKYDLEKLAKTLNYENDTLFTHTGLSTLMKRYALRDRNQKIIETPQIFWMRIAMGLAFNEEKPTDYAILFYNKMAALEYIPGGSTNISAGTSKPRLSNCYLMDMEDDISHIGKTVSDVMKLSKATGGIGLSVTKLRASGSEISTNNTFSSGPIPFLHIIDSTIRAISRAGKKMGALCFYMENWHLDFNDFLDLKQNAGDDYRRARTANIAVYLSDEFMKRVSKDDYWYLFDPKETPELIELYGEEFSKKYAEYIKLAEDGKIKRFKKLKAKDQWRQIIVSLQGTSHPWITFKDAINVKALNNNTGTIHCSNLCTEITLPQNKDNVSVCNLLSINLAKHLTDGKVDWDKLRNSVELGVRQLDNLVDINEPPVPEAKNFDSKNRAIGLGVMGFSDMLERLNFAYESQEGYNLADKVFEYISYYAIKTSAALAQEKGSYDFFSGSLWSQGYVPLDTMKRLEENRQIKLETDDKSYLPELDWNRLREAVKRGMRNSTLMAVAPTANIGLVAGTSTGIDPRFAQIFSRNTLSGKYLEINPNLEQKLKDLNLWQNVKDQILSNQGDVSSLDVISDEVKNVYRTSFDIAPEAFIEVAARAQKWIDQALSRNMYLNTRDTEEIMNIYELAWKKGLKTTYYLHMKPRHRAEQSTVKVNKSEGIGKKGFGALLKKKTITEDKIKNNNQACPVDPMERLQCDSCQ